ncbi:MAG: branched-chain amino acid aminotransferase, partial [Pedobacter sp.]
MQYYNSETIIYTDGAFRKAKDTTTDLYSQSLHYGYAIFEGLRAYNTHKGVKIFKARAHFDRLQRSCELVNIPFPWNKEELLEKTYELLELNGLDDAYVRPLVYCAPNMSLTAPLDVSIMICAWKWGAYLGDKQLRVCLSSFQRPNPRSTHVEAKVSGHYINSILATTEAKSRGFDEALLLDMNEHVAEGPGANIFIEKNGKLFTPSKGNILSGITRATVFEICNLLEIEVEEARISVN